MASPSASTIQIPTPASHPGKLETGSSPHVKVDHSFGRIRTLASWLLPWGLAGNNGGGSSLPWIYPRLRGPAVPTYYLGSDPHVGAFGLKSRTMPASAGVWSPLRWLHRLHEEIVLVQLFLPPRDVGMMWSTVDAGCAQ